MHGKLCEVVFNQDNGISYIAKYIEYSDVDKKIDVELINPMTGKLVHTFKLLV